MTSVKNICVFVFCLVSAFAYGQSFDDLNHKEIGLNMIPLVWNLTPFNTNALPLQRYNFKYRRVKNGKIRAFGLGASVDRDDSDVFNFNLTLGREKRKYLGEKWNFYIGHNFATGINSDGEDRGAFDSNIDVYIGYSNSYAIEYLLNDQISVYTQTSLFVGFSTFSAISIRLEAPVSIFLNVKF